MANDPHALTYQLLAELGVKDPDPKLAAEVEEHFAKIIFETLLRRAPEHRLAEIRAKMESNAPDLENFVAEIAAEIPGLLEEIEESLAREYEAVNALLKF